MRACSCVRHHQVWKRMGMGLLIRIHGTDVPLELIDVPRVAANRVRPGRQLFIRFCGVRC